MRIGTSICTADMRARENAYADRARVLSPITLFDGFNGRVNASARARLSNEKATRVLARSTILINARVRYEGGKKIKNEYRNRPRNAFHDSSEKILVEERSRSKSVGRSRHIIIPTIRTSYT